MKIPKEELKQINIERYHRRKDTYEELLEKLKKCGNLNVEDKWDEVEMKYKIMRTERYIKAIESVMCDELQKLKDAICDEGEDK